jgi:hypothetical protein
MTSLYFFSSQSIDFSSSLIAFSLDLSFFQSSPVMLSKSFDVSLAISHRAAVPADTLASHNFAVSSLPFRKSSISCASFILLFTGSLTFIKSLIELHHFCSRFHELRFDFSICRAINLACARLVIAIAVANACSASLFIESIIWLGSDLIAFKSF